MFQFLKLLFKKKKQKTVLATNHWSHITYRFIVHKNNQIYLDWFGYAFPLEMQPDGSLICKEQGIQGYNKPYSGWTWREDDGGDYLKATF